MTDFAFALRHQLEELGLPIGGRDVELALPEDAYIAVRGAAFGEFRAVIQSDATDAGWFVLAGVRFSSNGRGLG